MISYFIIVKIGVNADTEKVNGMETLYPERITGEGFYLRRWRVEDAGWYVAARDEEIFRWTKESRDLTVAATEVAIDQVNAGSNALCFAIVDSQSQELLGNIALTFDEAHPKTVEIMYWLAPSARGRGIATRSVVLLSNWAVQAGRCDRITLKTLRENFPSQRVAERAGFHQMPGESREGQDTDYLWYEKMELS